MAETVVDAAVVLEKRERERARAEEAAPDVEGARGKALLAGARRQWPVERGPSSSSPGSWRPGSSPCCSSRRARRGRRPRRGSARARRRPSGSSATSRR